MKYFILLIFILLNSCEVKVQPNKNIGKSVLFIGNSLTYWNQGLDFHLIKLFESLEMNYTKMSAKTNSGFRLKFHWEDSYTFQRINEMKWDHVVIQESGFGIYNSPLESKYYLAQFDSLFKSDYSSSLHVFQNYAYESEIDYWPYIDSVFISYKDELNLDIIPVGEAFQLSAKNYSYIKLIDDDRIHPSLAGTYLSTAVYFAFLFDVNPEESSYVPVGMFASEIADLNDVAWEIYRKHHTKH